MQFVNLSWLWLLLAIFLILIPLLLIPGKTFFVEEDVLQELISQDRHKKYSRLHVTEEVYQRYKHHKNIHLVKFDEKKHGKIRHHLKTSHNMNHELAELTAIAHKHLNPVILTNNDLKPETLKEFRKIKFMNPLKGAEKTGKEHNMGNSVIKKKNENISKHNKDIDELLERIEKAKKEGIRE
jgi:hypothetical protein